MRFFTNETPDAPKERVTEDEAPARRSLVGIAAVVLLGCAYGIASQTTGAPNYAATYDTAQPPKGTAGSGSMITSVLSAMIQDERARGWSPAKSFLTPSSWRTDTRAFQLGKEAVFSRIAYTLREVVASQGSLTKIDPDLNSAVEDIQAGPSRWMPVIGTDSKYGDAVRHFDAYNARLANGAAIFSPRIDNLSEVLKTIIHATGGQTEKMGSFDDNSWFLTGDTRAEFTRTKGVFAASCEFLKAIKVDFAEVIEKQSATDSFNAATTSVCAVQNENTPMFTFYLRSHLKSLKGAGAEAVAKLQNAETALASASRNGGGR